ncbi:MAG: hypothetical protein HY815_07505 [Candidatus Riflebacteria bacterium]|nr:hypothetical protein [Candidatus Riflebacteria bacterium]
MALKHLERFVQVPEKELLLAGPGGRLVLEDAIDGFLRGGKITPHSARIAKVQARILTGGDKASPTSPVSEEYILELEIPAVARPSEAKAGKEEERKDRRCT